MTVFKGYLLMIKRNAQHILLYVGIFSALAVMISMSTGSSTESGFAADKMDILLVDEDHSEISGYIADYLKKRHEVTETEYDKKMLYEKLYYQEYNLVLHIPRGMEEELGSGSNVIEMTQAPGNFDGEYVEQQINGLLSGIQNYQKVGYTAGEAYRKMLDIPEAKVSVMNLRGENANYSNFFRSLPYMLIAGLGNGAAAVIFAFRKREVKNRMMVSCVPIARQNFEGVSAICLVGFSLMAAVMAAAVIFFGVGFLESGLFWYYLLNMFLDTLLALSIAFLVGVLVKRDVTVTMCITPLSLAFAFLGGVFMPLDFLSAEVQMIAKFIPVYWYEVANDLLMRYSDISGAVQTKLWQAYGMQALFVVMIFSVGLVITKYQQQEK